MNFNKILDLSFKKPVLNKNLMFFSHQENDYAYLNQYPFIISFMELGNKMIDMLNQFDGTKTVNEIRREYKLDSDCFEFINTLIKNRILETKVVNYSILPEDVLALIFSPTSSCNLRCVYCYASAGETQPLNRDIKKAELWIQHLFENISPDIKKVTLTFHGGGEPTNAPCLLFVSIIINTIIICGLVYLLLSFCYLLTHVTQGIGFNNSEHLWRRLRLLRLRGFSQINRLIIWLKPNV